MPDTCSFLRLGHHVEESLVTFVITANRCSFLPSPSLTGGFTAREHIKNYGVIMHDFAPRFMAESEKWHKSSMILLDAVVSMWNVCHRLVCSNTWSLKWCAIGSGELRNLWEVRPCWRKWITEKQGTKFIGLSLLVSPVSCSSQIWCDGSSTQDEIPAMMTLYSLKPWAKIKPFSMKLLLVWCLDTAARN